MKRKRKKVNKERMKLQLKMSLNMRQKDDLGPTDEGDEEIFQLSQITSEKVNTGYILMNIKFLSKNIK